MSLHSLNCPHCGRVNQHRSTAEGRRKKCNHCKKDYLVPDNLAAGFVPEADVTGPDGIPTAQFTDGLSTSPRTASTWGEQEVRGLLVGAVLVCGLLLTCGIIAFSNRPSSPTGNQQQAKQTSAEGRPGVATVTPSPKPALPPREPSLAETIQQQREALAKSDPQVRIKAAERLGKLGAKAAEAVPALVESLATEDAKVKTAVIEALGKIGPAAVTARNSLLPLLTKSPGEIKRAAAQALILIGTDASARPEWLQAFQDEDEQVTGLAAKALVAAGACPADEQPIYIELLKKGKPVQRRHAALFLGDMKAEGKPVVSALSEALRDVAPEVRIEAAVALGKIGGKAGGASAALGHALQDK